MSLVCGLSGEAPEEPVVSRVSGGIFERRLILKYIAENGRDPLTEEPLGEHDLIAVKVPKTVRPRPPSATSIPALLKTLQDEWDALMLETFKLKQHYDQSQKELTHTLYQHDAACRVIARLTRERDAARQALANVQVSSHASNAGASAMDTEGDAAAAANAGSTTLPSQVVTAMQEASKPLSDARRGRKKPAGLTSQDAIAQFQQTEARSGIHSASQPGILALDVHAADPFRVVTGGADKTAKLFDRSSGQVTGTLSGHKGAVKSVLFHPSSDVVVTGSADRTVRVWTSSNESCQHVIQAHTKEVTSVTLQPTGRYVVSSGLDGKWAFSDIETGATYAKQHDPQSSGLTTAQFHPDGLILATGSVDGVVRIWDANEMTNVLNFSEHTAPITSVVFSENGYYMASAAQDRTVRLWDLRAASPQSIQQMQVEDTVHALAFDLSGTYLATAGPDIRVFLAKQWKQIAQFTTPTATSTAIKFGPNASFLTTAGMDRHLRVFSTPS
ncbi:Nmp200-prov protein [Capsaspora owczarzaki ATCC 30864]|uniref:Pre-mRNA-processing factor 19 n=1 Tax=Capsaspora owczarzaki (strain ATCC 30864) TaxID=595528 RepID=A0A0D2VPB7_CAPO3|nr:Nmp200-prov protein [Capsaspora owczarzaki ATCC 30864]KJE92292.1 Nmp200-prov protein [Capsaspora owczarzaki ATCC 30864]|eukprot:XP_004364132.1 Nmp200-prov protein [Capsaspora owczarzaki ATCC 30864]